MARIGGLTLTAGLLGVALAGCQTTSAASPASASPSPGLSIPGTHRSTTEYRISSPVSTVIMISHAGNVTVTGGGGSATSVTQDATYSKTPPVTTRTVSGGTLTITYSCPVQLVCGVGYVVQVPRDAGVQVSAAAGTIRLSGLAGNVTAKADVGLIDAVGLTGTSVALTTEAGGITAALCDPAGHRPGCRQGRSHYAPGSRWGVLPGLRERPRGQGHRQRPAELLVRPCHHRDHGRRRHRGGAGGLARRASASARQSMGR